MNGEKTMIKKGIIFDLDGTLWDTTESTYNSVNEIAKRHNLPEVTKETICNVFGCTAREAASQYFPSIDIEKALPFMEEISVIKNRDLKENGAIVYDKVEETLIKLKNDFEFFIVSNSRHKGYIEAFLISSGLEKYFTAYYSTGELNMTKADTILKTIKEYQLDKFVYVGDTKKDLEATNISKVPFIQAKYGFGKDLNTKYYINTFAELPQVVKEIF